KDPDNIKYPVITTLNQIRLQGDVIVRSNNLTTLLPHGYRELPNVQWVHHDQTGYVFFEPTTARLRNETAQGAWRTINWQSDNTDERIKGDLFTLWLDHGPIPAPTTYAYAIFPGQSLENMQQQADAPGVKV